MVIYWPLDFGFVVLWRLHLGRYLGRYLCTVNYLHCKCIHMSVGLKKPYPYEFVSCKMNINTLLFISFYILTRV